MIQWDLSYNNKNTVSSTDNFTWNITWSKIRNTLPIPDLRHTWAQYDTIVKVIHNPQVDTTPPTWLKPSNNPDINYWLQEVLPREEERHHKEYLVIPYLGVIAPINHVSSTGTDRERLLEWYDINRNKYLLSWLNLYPGTAKIGMSGNSVIWGHSNYYKNVISHYKTIFTKLPELIKNDEVRVYRKQSNNTRVMYRYTIKQSFEMSTFDKSIVAQDLSKKEITLYTCVPIGTSKNRWIVKGELVETRIMK